MRLQVKVWEIPPHGVLKNLTVPWKELLGHSRRVGLIEWHPTAINILFSTAYDYQVTQTDTHTLALTRQGTLSYCDILYYVFRYNAAKQVAAQ